MRHTCETKIATPASLRRWARHLKAYLLREARARAASSIAYQVPWSRLSFDMDPITLSTTALGLLVACLAPETQSSVALPMTRFLISGTIL